MKKFLAIGLTSLLSLVPMAAMAEPNGSVTLSQTSFVNASLPNNSAVVTVSLGDEKGIQFLYLTCGVFFSASAAPGYKTILLTSETGVAKSANTGNLNVRTKLVGNVYATTSLNFTFNLGFGAGGFKSAGSCQPKLYVTDAKGVITTKSVGSTLYFRQLSATPKPSPSATTTPSLTPSPTSSAPVNTDECRTGLSSSEQEIEDWRVPTNLPKLLEGTECTNLVPYQSSIDFDPSKKAGFISDSYKELLTWRMLRLPPVSNVVCEYSFPAKATSAVKAGIKKDATALCTLAKKYKPTAKTAVKQAKATSKSPQQVTLRFS